MLKRLIRFFLNLFKKNEEVIEPQNSGATESHVDSGHTTVISNNGEMDNGEEVDTTEPVDICSGYKSTIKILVDNGHGNNTQGKRSPWSANGVEPELDFYEYKWNREIAHAVVYELQKHGYDAEILVPEDYDVSLSERVHRVNSACSIYGAANVILISVHANAAGNGKEWMSGRGWCAYTSRGNTKSDEIAEFLYREAAKNFSGMKLRADNSDGDSDQEADFYIIKKTYCPAVLTENFFFDNIDDVKYILSDEGKKAVIKTHVDGIINYINSL